MSSSTTGNNSSGMPPSAVLKYNRRRAVSTTSHRFSICSFGARIEYCRSGKISKTHPLAGCSQHLLLSNPRSTRTNICFNLEVPLHLLKPHGTCMTGCSPFIFEEEISRRPASIWRIGIRLFTVGTFIHPSRTSSSIRRGIHGVRIHRKMWSFTRSVAIQPTKPLWTRSRGQGTIMSKPRNQARQDTWIRSLS